MFDEGWDAYREMVFARQKELGIVPADAELSRHDPDVPDWASLAPGGPTAVQPDDGGLRRVPVPRRSPGRAAGRVLARARGAGQRTRYRRDLTEERTREKNRTEKLLESARRSSCRP